MSNDSVPSHDQVSALAALVRDGTLTREQREQAAVLLCMIVPASAPASAPQPAGPDRLWLNDDATRK